MQSFCFTELFDMFKTPFVNCYLIRLPSFEKCKRAVEQCTNKRAVAKIDIRNLFCVAAKSYLNTVL